MRLENKSVLEPGVEIMASPCRPLKSLSSYLFPLSRHLPWEIWTVGRFAAIPRIKELGYSPHHTVSHSWWMTFKWPSPPPPLSEIASWRMGHIPGQESQIYSAMDRFLNAINQNGLWPQTHTTWPLSGLPCSHEGWNESLCPGLDSLSSASASAKTQAHPRRSPGPGYTQPPAYSRCHARSQTDVINPSLQLGCHGEGIVRWGFLHAAG